MSDYNDCCPGCGYRASFGHVCPPSDYVPVLSPQEIDDLEDEAEENRIADEFNDYMSDYWPDRY